MSTRATNNPQWPEGFSLSGPSTSLDPRINAFRKDIADIRLAGRVIASHYAYPAMHRCIAPTTMVLGEPKDDSRATSQLIAGEGFALLDRDGTWAWGYCEADGYVGYVALADIDHAGAEPTHRVTAPLALAFAQADLKSPLRQRLPMGARLVVTSMDNGFAETSLGWVHSRYLSAIGDAVADPVAVAERLVGTPYLWGGRAGDGLDCSGLVQLCLSLAGIAAPRDSDQQREQLGRAIAPDALQRGDLVFFPGHVGMMVDADRLIHANAWWMAVTIEPLAAVVARLRDTHAEPIAAVRRLG